MISLIVATDKKNMNLICSESENKEVVFWFL